MVQGTGAQDVRVLVGARRVGTHGRNVDNVLGQEAAIALELVVADAMLCGRGTVTGHGSLRLVMVLVRPAVRTPRTRTPGSGSVT